MSDKIKVNEVGRYIYAIFDSVTSINTCTFYMRDPSGSTTTLTCSAYSGTFSSTSIVGYRYQVQTTTTFGIIGDYKIDVYIETTAGYKGRRETLTLKVYDEFK